MSEKTNPTCLEYTIYLVNCSVIFEWQCRLHYAMECLMVVLWLHAGTQEATWNGTGTPQNGQTTSVYTLNFNGTCAVKTKLGNSLPLMAQSAAGSA